MINSEEAFTQASDLVKKLAHEMSSGRGDGKVADNIRDQLDPLWRRLSIEHKDALNKLSEDLYDENV